VAAFLVSSELALITASFGLCSTSAAFSVAAFLAGEAAFFSWVAAAFFSGAAAAFLAT